MRVIPKIALALISIPTMVFAVWRVTQAPQADTVSTLAAAKIAPPVVAATSDSFAIETGDQRAPAKSNKAPVGASNFPIQPTPPTAPMRDLTELKLSGILGTSGQGQSIALLGLKGSTPVVVRAGDDFLAWHIMAIEQHEVHLRRNEETIRIRVDAPESNNAKYVAMMDSAETPKFSNFYAGPRVAGVPGLD